MSKKRKHRRTGKRLSKSRHIDASLDRHAFSYKNSPVVNGTSAVACQVKRNKSIVTASHSKPFSRFSLAKVVERVKRWRVTEGRRSPAIACAEAVQRLSRKAKQNWSDLIQKHHDNQFPESDRMVVALLILLLSSFPQIQFLLQSRIQQIRSIAMHRFALARNWMERKKLRPVVFLGAAGVIAVTALFFSFYTIGTSVIYDGKPLANVESVGAVNEACDTLETITADTLHHTYQIDDSLLQYNYKLLPRKELVAAEELEEDLSDEIGLVEPGYALYVDGELIGATPYKGALEELLSQLKQSASDEATISCDFKEDVEVRDEYVPTDKIMNLGNLAELLFSTKEGEVTYTVAKGDCWSKIAQSHDLTTSELLAFNPGYNIDRLSIGEVLTISTAVPYLTQTVVKQEQYVSEVPYEIEYTDTESLYRGDYKVTSPGTYGSADVVANVTYINEAETERNILSYVTLVEPVTEYRLRGTKERPSWVATGTFRWPTNGHITSPFGYRKSPGGFGSSYHRGIDIANHRGTPIYAADGGTVSIAGWQGGYGYMVEINHNNGYTTRYAHCSSLLVSKGDHVYKGQQISRMGSTGNSTGNHCHFEIRYSGVPNNPMNYL